MGDRTLAEIKTCPKTGLPHEWRDEIRLDNWAAFLSAMSQTRPEGLSGLPVLKPKIENKEREATLLKFNPGSSFTPDQLRKQAWAPVENSTESASSDIFKVFLPQKGDSLDPPQGVRVRFLNQKFQETYEMADGKGLDAFLTKVLDVLRFSALSVVENSILPTLNPNQPVEPDCELIHFLKRLRDADSKESQKSVESFDWTDKVRRELIQKLFVVCQGRAWSILQVYAGEQWTENHFLEKADGDERGYLDVDPPANKEQRKSWSDFWKWLGVGWCPKVLPVVCEIVCAREDKKGLTLHGVESQVQFFQKQKPEKWEEYCQLLYTNKQFKGWDYKPRLKECWTLDEGAQVLTQEGAFDVIGKHWAAYEAWMQASIGYSSNAQKDNDKEANRVLPSHLAWLFRATKWVPCVDILQSGNNIFHASGAVAKELKGFVPLLSVTGGDTDIVKAFHDACGIRSSWNEVCDKDWKSWLAKASQMQPDATDDKEETRSAIRRLYRALLDHRKRKTGGKWNEQDAKPLAQIALWSIKCETDTSEHWCLIKAGEQKLFFVDRPDVVNVKLPQLHAFPVRLDDLAAKAKQHLGLRPLSEALAGVPTELGSDDERFTSRTKDRLHELMAYLRLENEGKCDDGLREHLQSVTLRVVTDLTVQFVLDDIPIGDPLVRRKLHQFDKAKHRWIMFVEPSCPDDERWEAFAETLLLSCKQSTGEALKVRELLRCKPDQLPEWLTKFGVAPETAESLRNQRDTHHEKKSVSPPSLPTANESEKPKSTPASGNLSPSQTTTSFPSGPAGAKASSSDERSVRTSSERNPGWEGDRQRRPSSRPHPEEGMRAQLWLFDRVKTWCDDNQLPPPTFDQDHVDITIQLDPPLLIEAKRNESSTIHWSRNQIEKAKKSPGRYVVALLRPIEGDEYEVFWVRRPLDAFLVMRRRVEWSWQKQYGASFHPGLWDEPENKPSKEASSFHAEITIEDSWRDKLPKGIGELKAILE